ncbi:hypothetical protein B0H13DRAFT_1936400 [Mycena leptocephala]|nr:hypothetical protein B0H13DRAFT_1936400 [Mycena leptocephala]
MTQFEHLPTTYADEYTVAFRSDESGIPSVHIPLFDFFVHILAQSYQYSAVEDTGIHLPRVDRLLHECYVYWNYVPKPIEVNESVDCIAKISFAQDLLLADSESDRKNPFLKFLPTLHADYYPKPAKLSPSSSDILLYDMELQYPESPAVKSTSVIPVLGSEEPEVMSEPARTLSICPPLHRLPLFSALLDKLKDMQNDNSASTEATDTAATPEQPLVLPTKDTDDEMPALSNSSDDNSISDHSDHYYNQMYARARAQDLPARFKTGDQRPLVPWPSPSPSTPLVYAVHVPEREPSAPNEFIVEVAATDSVNVPGLGNREFIGETVPPLPRTHFNSNSEANYNSTTSDDLHMTTTRPSQMILESAGLISTKEPATPNFSVMVSDLNGELDDDLSDLSSLSSRPELLDLSEFTELQAPLSDGVGCLVQILDRGYHYQRLFEAATYWEEIGSPLFC